MARIALTAARVAHLSGNIPGLHPTGANTGRYFGLFMIIAACAVLTAGLFWVAHKDAQIRLNKKFEGDAGIRTHLVIDELNHHAAHINTMGRYLDTFEDVDRKRFEMLAARMLDDGYKGPALEWVPKVTSERRTLYEADARREGLKGFRFTELDQKGAVIPAESRQVYYPGYYVEPLSGNDKSLGFDHGSVPARLGALNKACDTGRPSITGRINLIHGDGRYSGIVIYKPIYEKGMPSHTEKQRRHALKGFIAGALPSGVLIEDALEFMPPEDMVIELVDPAAPPDERVFSRWSSPLSGRDEPFGIFSLYPATLNYSRHFYFAGRQLRIDAAAGSIYSRQYYSVSHWLIPPSGIMLAMILFSYLRAALTRRERAEALVNERTAELELSEKKYRGLFEQSREGLVICDLKGIILDANQATLDMMGYSLDEIRGRNYREFIPEKWRDLDADLIRNQLFKRGYSEFQDRECIRKDGSVIPTSVRAWLLKDAQEGRATGVIVWFQDITEIKKALEALKKNETGLQEAQALAHIGSWEFDLVSSDLQWSNECYRIFEIDQSELKVSYDHFLALVHPQEQGRVNEAFLQSVLSHEQNVIEHRLLMPDGRIKYIHQDFKVFFDDQGRPVRLAGTAQDITERKNFEEESRINQLRMESLLRISQGKFDTVQELLDFALDESIRLTGSRIGYIYYYDDVSMEFTLNTWSRDVMKECSINEKKTVYHLDKTGIWGEAVRQARPVMLNDFKASHPLKKGYPEGHAPLYRFLTIPVFSKGRIVAVVGVANKDSDYTTSDIQQLTLLMQSVWQVAERKKVEQALQSEKDRVQMYLDTAGVMFLVLDKDAVVTLINRKGCELTGFAESEIIGRNWFETIIPEEERGMLKHAFDRIIAGEIEHAEYHENSIVTKSGKNRLFAWRSTVIRDGDGNVTGTLSSGDDITEKRLAEQELHVSRERFRKIIEDMPLAASYTDEEGNIEYSNRVFVELFGYSREDIPTIEDWFAYAYPDPMYREEVMARWNADATRAKVEGTKIGPGEYTITCKDGTLRTCEITGTFMEKGLMAVFNDITERIHAEEKIRQSEERFRVQFKGIPVPTCIWEYRGGDFYLLDYNDAAVDFTRGRIATYLGIAASRFYDGKAWYTDDMKRCHEERTQVENRFWDNLRTTGEKKFLAVKYAYVPPNLVMVHMEDITLQKEAEEHLRYLSMHDPLTGLYNRLYSDTEIERLKSSRKYPVSVMVVDIDGLKTVNDKDGHAAGDQLIKNAAYVLKQTFRPEDMVARIGGDEFLVVLPLMDGIVLDQSLRRLKVYLANFNASSPDTPVSFSVGTATAHSSDDLENCIKQADMVMYLEKARMKALHSGD